MNKRTKAKEMYQSPLFKHSLEYAERLNRDKIFILSAHYGLLTLNTEIKPYDMTISNVSKKNRERKPQLKVLTKDEKVIWGQKILLELSNISDLKKDKFIVLAGLEYINSIINFLVNIEQPLKGVGLFDRISYLKKLKDEI
ncbi:hypothetical protein Lupro_11840 [Lutibacter profundi]|uniref:DUF6884 domain-containing protein n=2 Tax=Lutibacter profundi TaxID=1622118 RepID=A0A0X8G8B7_9FLAO|nr:DUF6884 domain-containing protein [Lutibacter profundi]AMC11914.1 hypothetical protein Lupro_11840 [Lutibacter profundi]